MPGKRSRWPSRATSRHPCRSDSGSKNCSTRAFDTLPRVSGLWGSLLLGSALSLAVCSAVATQSLILGAPEGGWFYGYLRTFSIRPVGASLIVTALSTALLLAARRWLRSREWPLVFAWIATGIALQALLRSLTPVTLEAIFLSDGANSFYSVTQQHHPATVLSAFEDVR